MDKTIIIEYDYNSIYYNWYKIREIIRPAVDRNETLEVDDVFNLVRSGLARIFAAVKDGKPFAVFLIEKVKGIRKSFIRVVLAAGEPMKDWIDPFIKLMDKLCIAEDIEFYEMIGRLGWKRALKDIGYESEMIYRRKL